MLNDRPYSTVSKVLSGLYTTGLTGLWDGFTAQSILQLFIGEPLSQAFIKTIIRNSHSNNRTDNDQNISGMNNPNTHDQRIAKMTFASVYPMYIEKVQKKGRTKEELHQVIEWLTGFDNKKLQELIKEKVTFETFFQHASLNPNSHLITGVICGYRVEEIENPLTQQVRYLDKLVDELAKGRKMEKILRGS